MFKSKKIKINSKKKKLNVFYLFIFAFKTDNKRIHK